MLLLQNSFSNLIFNELKTLSPSNLSHLTLTHSHELLVLAPSVIFSIIVSITYSIYCALPVPFGTNFK